MADDLDLARVRDRLTETLGPRTYNRLVESVGEVRGCGRLRYWQEQHLRKAAAQTGVLITTVEEFIRVFDGASALPIPAARRVPIIPWTREAFFSHVERSWFGEFPLDETPPEWMAAAWEIDRVRDAYSSEMARTVSKLGELFYTPEWLRYLSRALPVPRQVELYLYLRNDSPHRENEFRPDFERAFPDCVAFLPPPLATKQAAEVLGMEEEEYERTFLSPDREWPEPEPTSEGHEVEDGNH